MNKYRLPQSLGVEIADYAEFVAQEYFPNEAVEPLEILSAKGITFSANDYGSDFDGMIEHQSGRFHVYLNLNQVETVSSSKARFTLCHELGHYFLDDHRNALLSGSTPSHPSRCEFESGNPVEVQADFFASNLLMPAGRIKKASRNLGDGLEAVLEIAQRYKASLTAAAVRYVNLELSSSVLVRWHDNGKVWMTSSPTVWVEGYRTTIQSFNGLPSDSATCQAARDEATFGGFHKSVTTASYWFPFVSESSANNFLMHEESMKLGRFGGITMLTAVDGSFPKAPLGHYV